MKSIDLCTVEVFKPFLPCLERRNIDYARHLRRHNVSVDMVESGTGFITRQQVWQFFRTIETKEGLQTLGLLDGDPLSLKDFGSFGRSIMNAVTFKDAVHTFQNLVPSFADDNVAILQTGPDQSGLFLHCSGVTDADKGTDHASLRIVLEMVRLAGGPKWTPRHACLQTSSSPALALVPEFSECDVKFNRRNTGMLFPSSWLSQPLTVSNEMKETDFTNVMQPRPEQTIPESLQSLMESMLPFFGLPSAQMLAEMLGVSRMTLHTALRSEGTSYRKVSERARFKTARILLQNPSMSVKEIAYELGYASPSSFVRAFHHMTGQTPKQFRNKDSES